MRFFFLHIFALLNYSFKNIYVVELGERAERVRRARRNRDRDFFDGISLHVRGNSELDLCLQEWQDGTVGAVTAAFQVFLGFKLESGAGAGI